MTKQFRIFCFSLGIAFGGTMFTGYVEFHSMLTNRAGLNVTTRVSYNRLQFSRKYTVFLYTLAFLLIFAMLLIGSGYRSFCYFDGGCVEYWDF